MFTRVLQLIVSLGGITSVSTRYIAENAISVLEQSPIAYVRNAEPRGSAPLGATARLGRLSDVGLLTINDSGALVRNPCLGLGQRPSDIMHDFLTLTYGFSLSWIAGSLQAHHPPGSGGIVPIPLAALVSQAHEEPKEPTLSY